jgi:hypothetical protein
MNDERRRSIRSREGVWVYKVKVTRRRGGVRHEKSWSEGLGGESEHTDPNRE